jgi:hypothetical protein
MLTEDSSGDLAFELVVCYSRIARRESSCTEYSISANIAGGAPTEPTTGVLGYQHFASAATARGRVHGGSVSRNSENFHTSVSDVVR